MNDPMTFYDFCGEYCKCFTASDARAEMMCLLRFWKEVNRRGTKTDEVEE